jgi:hypothetical protein
MSLENHKHNKHNCHKQWHLNWIMHVRKPVPMNWSEVKFFMASWLFSFMKRYQDIANLDS